MQDLRREALEGLVLDQLTADPGPRQETSTWSSTRPFDRTTTRFGPETRPPARRG